MNRMSAQRLFCSLVYFFLVSTSSVTVAQEFSVYSNNARLLPAEPSVAQDVFVVIEQSDICKLVELGAIALDEQSKTFHVSIVPPAAEFDPCPKTNLPPVRVPLPKVSQEGAYTLKVYVEHYFHEQTFDPENLKVTHEFAIEPSPQYWFETPQQDSIQSGVGLVRGWACDAESVQIQFNDLPLLDAGYGASRADTMEICGDDNNGYGLAYAWGLLGEGEHRMKTYIDGEIVSDVGFQVAHLGEPFVTGLSGSVEVTDFPAPGESVILEWSEAAQNFVIVEYRRGTSG